MSGSWNRREFLGRVAALTAIGIAAGRKGYGRWRYPNIVLAISDDQGRDLCGCYGNQNIKTPVIDRLASEGVRFDQAFVTTSQCSPSRSSIYTGKSAHTVGAEKLHTPLLASEWIFTDTLKWLGYNTVAWEKWHLGTAKHPGQPFDDIAANQPFFYQLGYHEPHRNWRHPVTYKPKDVIVPPTLPDTRVVREDLAGYYSDITWMDNHLGEFLKKLPQAVAEENTIVIFCGDNGPPFPGEKGTCYDAGLLVPFIIKWPGVTKPGTVIDDMVSLMDICPTVLSMAGTDYPRDVQSIDLTGHLKGEGAPVRDVIFGERNQHRYDDLIRSARTPRYKYIRNFMDYEPYKPPTDLERSPTWKEIVRLHKAGKLPNNLAHRYFDNPRPKEELYDLKNDPQEWDNLADKEELKEIKVELKARTKQWMID
ncbi:sulfatase, partial [candidate division KSB1 bacterium]